MTILKQKKYSVQPVAEASSDTEVRPLITAGQGNKRVPMTDDMVFNTEVRKQRLDFTLRQSLVGSYLLTSMNTKKEQVKRNKEQGVESCQNSARKNPPLQITKEQ